MSSVRAAPPAKSDRQSTPAAQSRQSSRADPPKDQSAEATQNEERPESEPSFKPISLALVRRLASWLKPYKWLYSVGVIFGLLSVGLELASPSMAQHIIDVDIKSGDTMSIVYSALIWGGILALAVLFDGLQIWTTNSCGERVVTDFRNAVFAHLQRLGMSYYDRTKLGRIITRGTSDMDSMRGTVVSGINTLALNLLMTVGAGTMIFLTDWRIFLAVCWLIPLLAFCNQVYRRKIGATWQMVRTHFSRLTANLAENITGVRVVSAFNRQEENLSRFNEMQDTNTTNNMKVANLNGIYQPLLEFIRFSGQVIVLAYGGVLVLGGSGLSPGNVIKCLFYWDYFMRPTINMGNFYNTLMQTMASAERVFQLLDTKPDVVDRPDAKPAPRFQGLVRFEQVTFGYDPARPVLHGIDLEIPAGRTYALVGATGSGKSSTVSLLARFYEFQQGRITVDGHDIRDATMQSLHKQMGLVLQVNYLFADTILENIRYPHPEATEEEVILAAKALDIHDVFMSLPDGYKTQVGERGANISVGLRQLICFARVFVANPSIFLLDEATSSIDTVTESKIQKALETLVKNRTTIIVAHRLSTIVKADCIVVLEHGRIIERGTHDLLIENKGVYAKMYERFVAHQSFDEPKPD